MPAVRNASLQGEERDDEEIFTKNCISTLAGDPRVMQFALKFVF